MDYDDEGGSPYGSSSSWDEGFSDNDLSHLSIEDALENQGMTEDFWREPEEDSVSPHEAMGGMTAGDLQLGRFSHVSDNVRMAAKGLQSGEINPHTVASITGQSFNEVQGAIEEFRRVTGESEENEFTSTQGSVHSRMQVERPSAVTSIDPTGYQMSTKSVTGNPGLSAQQDVSVIGTQSNVVPRSREDLLTAVSMMGNTAESYLERGSGGGVPGNFVGSSELEALQTKGTEEPLSYLEYNKLTTRTRADENFNKAIEDLKDISKLYSSDHVKAMKPDDPRRTHVEKLHFESLYNRFLGGTFYEGSKALVPLGNETGVLYSRLTMGRSGWAPTALTRLQYREKYGADKEPGIVDHPKEFGDVGNTLFPIGKNVNDFKAAKIKQKAQVEDLYSRAESIRKTLRKELPTHRDESLGQSNTVGWDKIDTEQADQANLMNESNVLDLDYRGEGLTEARLFQESMLEKAEDTEVDIDDLVKDSEAMDEALLIAMPVQHNPIGLDEQESPLTDRDRYLASIARDKPPEQRSPEWYALRKGKLTASMASETAKGAGHTAIAIAQQEYKEDSDTGWAARGRNFEDKAKRAFLAGPGKGMTAEEAYFQTREGLEGFGASPDSMVFDKDGKSAGVLELKIKQASTWDGILEKHRDQVQMQMMVADEQVGHLYAINADDPTDSFYERIEADPVAQARIEKEGRKALAIAGNIKGVADEQVYRNMDKLQGKAQRAAGKAELNTTARYAGKVDEVEAPMKAYRPGYSPNESSSSEDRYVDQDNGKWNNELTSDMQDLSNATDESSESNEDLAKAARKAAREINSMTTSVQKTARAMSEIGGLLLSGMQSGMDEVTVAANAGITTDQSRGIRERLMVGGNLSDDQASASITSAGKTVTKMNDPAQWRGEWGRLQKGMATLSMEIPSLRQKSLPSLEEFKSMDAQQMIAWQMEMGSDVSVQGRTALYNLLENTNLKQLNQNLTGDEVRSALGSVDDEGIRAASTGAARVELEAREILEGTTETLGETGGAAAKYAEYAAVAASSVVGGAALGKMLKTGKGANLSKLKTSAALPTEKARNALKGASKAGQFLKATPVGLLGTGATMAVRGVTGVEDDGGFADSGLDIIEDAMVGASAGGLLLGGIGLAALGPAGGAVGMGVGGIVGTVAGTVGGVAHEAYQALVGHEAFSDMPGDDYTSWSAVGYEDSSGVPGDGYVPEGSNPPVVPSASLGSIKSKTKEGTTINNDTNVTVVVDPDLVTTTIENNGMTYVDREHTNNK